MNSKEAFRFLSHKFHGKGSGKLKTEKRFRKVTGSTVFLLITPSPARWRRRS